MNTDAQPVLINSTAVNKMTLLYLMFPLSMNSVVSERGSIGKAFLRVNEIMTAQSALSF
jgi:hypothetical protein